MTTITIKEASQKYCPFIGKPCATDYCMAWETTRITESIAIKPIGKGWEYDEEYGRWFRDLPHEQWRGYCKLMDKQEHSFR